MDADYIVVGGGLTGCALASKLRHAGKVVLIEAGPDTSDDPATFADTAMFSNLGTKLNYNFKTLPNPHTNGRVHDMAAGKVLGGTSVLNFGGWHRAQHQDYDYWAQKVGDDRWSYKNMLPYMQRSEKYFDKDADPQLHGFEGPMHIIGSSVRDVGQHRALRDPVLTAWEEMGLKRIDPYGSESEGVKEWLENWHNGKRQPSYTAYPLEGVHVMTETPVQRVLFEGLRAVGVELLDGRTFHASKEVILSAGAARTPQLLMLSGIGPAEALQAHKIPIVKDEPDVGANLGNHYALFQHWKLKQPSSLGSALYGEQKGLPGDWMAHVSTPSQALETAIAQDRNDPSAQDLDLLLAPGRAHVEQFIGSWSMRPDLAQDGSYCLSYSMLEVPTSRGRVSISSSSAADPPVLDTNYQATATDRAMLLHGVKQMVQCLTGTKAGKAIIEGEAAPPGASPLTAESSDEEIDARIRAYGAAHYHPGGTAAMGTVLDTELRVKGVQGLRVADTSVFPCCISGHPQATLYALAEKAADIIVAA